MKIVNHTNEDVNILTCGRCGSLITDKTEATHTRWHIGINDLIKELSRIAIGHEDLINNLIRIL